MDRNAATTVGAQACSRWPWQRAAARTCPGTSTRRSRAARGGARARHRRRCPRRLSAALAAQHAAGGSVLGQRRGQRAAAAGRRQRLAGAPRVARHPGAIGVLEVRGAQRVILPISAGGKPVDLELPPGVYTPTTPQLTVSWGAAVAPQPQSPPTR